MDEILVAVDGSALSEKVVSVAVDLAKKSSSKILLVNVMNLPRDEPQGIYDYEHIENYPDAYSDYLKSLSDNLLGKLSKQIESSGVEFRVSTPPGNPAKEIIDLANLDNVKMIVIGLKGLHGIGLVNSLGSVSRRVIENSKVPVCVVP